MISTSLENASDMGAIIPISNPGAIAVRLAQTCESMIPLRPWQQGSTRMSAEEEQAFVIRDRRGRGDEKPQSPQPEPAPGSTAESQETAASQDQGSASDMVPPLTFASFVFSLGTSALMLMGEQLDPQQGRPP